MIACKLTNQDWLNAIRRPLDLDNARISIHAVDFFTRNALTILGTYSQVFGISDSELFHTKDSRFDRKWTVCPLFVDVSEIVLDRLYGYSVPRSCIAQQAEGKLISNYLLLLRELIEKSGIQFAAIVTAQPRDLLSRIARMTLDDFKVMASGPFPQVAVALRPPYRGLLDGQLCRMVIQDFKLQPRQSQMDIAMNWTAAQRGCSGRASSGYGTAILEWINSLGLALGISCSARFAIALSGERVTRRCKAKRGQALSTALNQTQLEEEKDVMWGMLSRVLRPDSCTAEIAEAVFAAAVLLPEIFVRYRSVPLGARVKRIEKLVAGITHVTGC
jgi:hypothetical protein